MEDDAFARVMADGRAAVLAGTHAVEVSPRESGRWGISMVFLPSGELAAALDALTAEAVEAIGDGHWRSGAMGRAHATIRALERYDDAAIPLDRLRRYVGALERALATVGPVHLEFEGLVLAVGTVMARASASHAGGTAGELRRQLGIELGPDGWLEDQFFESGRDPIWYCSLVHFAAPLASPQELVDWVDTRRSVAIGSETFASVALCQWRFEGNGMTPVVVAHVSA
jgi:hypothetical protein